MKQPVFISLENTFEAAMYYRNSQQMEFYSFGGVQILPNQDNPYIQRTYADGGLELEDYTVWVTSICGERLFDISPYFEIVRNFDDPVTGTPQIEWQLIGVEYDAGYQLVYLEIEQGVNDVKYSSPFYLTADMGDKTARIDYGNDDTLKLLSTGLQMWYKYDDELCEQETYDTITTGRRTTANTKMVEYEVWQTEVIDIKIWRKLKQAFRNKFVYVDLQRTSMFEVFESTRPEGKENYAETELTLCRDPYDVYDPLYVPPIPPDPPIDEPFINLISVVSVDRKSVSYTFEYGNFMPYAFTYQYSLDGVNWTDVTNDTVSPKFPINVPDNDTLDYYYRIKDPISGLTSNVVHITPPSITINNITSPQSSFIQIGNNYSIFYTLNSFTPVSALSFEGSFDDGTTWQPLYYSSGYQNPKPVQTPSSSLQFTKFRIRYNPYGITSNVFNFEF